MVSLCLTLFGLALLRLAMGITHSNTSRMLANTRAKLAAVILPVLTL